MNTERNKAIVKALYNDRKSGANLLKLRAGPKVIQLPCTKTKNKILSCGKADMAPQDHERTPPPGDIFACNHPNCYYFREGGKFCKPHNKMSCSEEDRA